MNFRKLFFSLLTVLVIFSVVGFFAWRFVKEQLRLSRAIDLITAERVGKDQESVTFPVRAPKVIEKIVSKSEMWRPTQEKIKDTVVQVFSQIAEFDMLQPYKTPNQYTAYGSGFLINDQGDIITNAHVVNQAKAIWIQIPSLGKRILDVSVVGVSPERDLALLRVSDESRAIIQHELGKISYLSLGDSDLVHRADDVMALGYPLGQQSLKSTTGVISGRESQFIQMSAAINPGNSGGPLLNVNGEVVGINAAGISEAQNVGYIIPINDLKIVLSDLYKVKLLRKPFLGVLYNNASDTLVEFLGNPKPGGCYVVEVIKNSPLSKAGVKRGDMVYAIDGHFVDLYGEMSVPWSEDRISIVNYVSRLSIGDNVHLVVYRKGERKELSVIFSQASLPSVRRVYPAYEDIGYEVFGGMVVMELTLNHVGVFANVAPGLIKYADLGSQSEPVLVVTHIFPTSQLYRSRNIAVGSTINEVNGVDVHTLEDFRAALNRSVKSKFLSIRASDNVARVSDNIFVVLPFDKVLAEEPMLARDYRYPLSDMVKTLLAEAKQVDTQQSAHVAGAVKAKAN